MVDGLFSRRGAARLESDADSALRSLCSSRLRLPLRSFVVRAERAGGAQLGRTLLVRSYATGAGDLYIVSHVR